MATLTTSTLKCPPQPKPPSQNATRRKTTRWVALTTAIEQVGGDQNGNVFSQNTCRREQCVVFYTYGRGSAVRGPLLLVRRGFVRVCAYMCECVCVCVCVCVFVARSVKCVLLST